MQYSPATAVDTCCASHWLHVLQYWQLNCLHVLTTMTLTGNWTLVMDSTSKGKRDGSIPGIYLLCTMWEAPTHYVGVPGNTSWLAWPDVCVKDTLWNESSLPPPACTPPMFHYSMLDPLLDEIIEDILHNQTVKEQPIPSDFWVSSSAGHFVISRALDWSVWGHPFTSTVLLTCSAPFIQITGSSRLASHLGSVKSPYEPSIRSTMGLCTGAAVSLCLITREPLFATLTCAEGSSCAGTQPISPLCC
jgi:hypothetical protein